MNKIHWQQLLIVPIIAITPLLSFADNTNGATLGCYFGSGYCCQIKAKDKDASTCISYYQYKFIDPSIENSPEGMSGAAAAGISQANQAVDQFVKPYSGSSVSSNERSEFQSTPPPSYQYQPRRRPAPAPNTEQRPRQQSTPATEQNFTVEPNTYQAPKVPGYY